MLKMEGVNRLQDALSALLLLPDGEKKARGLTDTPREIQQQPETWLGTLERLNAVQAPLLKFLEGCGFFAGSAAQPDVILTGRSEERRVGKECRSRWSPYH